MWRQSSHSRSSGCPDTLQASAAKGARVSEEVAIRLMQTNPVRHHTLPHLHRPEQGSGPGVPSFSGPGAPSFSGPGVRGFRCIAAFLRPRTSAYPPHTLRIPSPYPPHPCQTLQLIPAPSASLLARPMRSALLTCRTVGGSGGALYRTVAAAPCLASVCNVCSACTVTGDGGARQRQDRP